MQAKTTPNPWLKDARQNGQLDKELLEHSHPWETASREIDPATHQTLLAQQHEEGKVVGFVMEGDDKSSSSSEEQKWWWCPNLNLELYISQPDCRGACIEEAGFGLCFSCRLGLKQSSRC